MLLNSVERCVAATGTGLRPETGSDSSIPPRNQPAGRGLVGSEVLQLEVGVRPGQTLLVSGASGGVGSGCSAIRRRIVGETRVPFRSTAESLLPCVSKASTT
ncbi:hypothetical protein ACIRYZ_37240 [Kitasatospora sp. NPDC101155]|uniref:hypothetical protein n=1 Tax=Kitasatospora sp. NPDC101155 TaxID=3364097 RepID=UPI003823D59E